MNDIARTIIVVIVHTPLWVWGLYALLLFLGVQRIRDSTVSLWRVLILPAVVMLMSILGLVGAGPASLAATLIGLAAGAAAGWPLERPDAIRRMPGGRLWLRGEWLSLIQIMLVLVARYATNAVSAMNPVLNADPVWHLGTLFGCALLSGIFLGRTARRLRVWFGTAPAAAMEIAATRQA